MHWKNFFIFLSSLWGRSPCDQPLPKSLWVVYETTLSSSSLPTAKISLWSWQKEPKPYLFFHFYETQLDILGLVSTPHQEKEYQWQILDSFQNVPSMYSLQSSKNSTNLWVQFMDHHFMLVAERPHCHPFIWSQELKESLRTVPLGDRFPTKTKTEVKFDNKALLLKPKFHWNFLQMNPPVLLFYFPLEPKN